MILLQTDVWVFSNFLEYLKGKNPPKRKLCHGLYLILIVVFFSHVCTLNSYFVGILFVCILCLNFILIFMDNI